MENGNGEESSKSKMVHVRPPPTLRELPTTTTTVAAASAQSTNMNNTSYHPDFMYCGECADDAAAVVVAGAGGVTKSSSSSSSSSSSELQQQQQQQRRDAAVWETVASDIANKKKQKQQAVSSPLHHPNHKKETYRGTVVRSQLLISNFDQVSQMVVIQSLLQELPSVVKVETKLQDQLVLVDHGAETTVDTMMRTLQKMGYHARDAMADMVTSPDDVLLGQPLVRSQFHVQGICCTSECPTITSIIQQLPGVSPNIQINITTRNVYVEYDPQMVSAVEIATALSKQGFAARILKDGAILQQTRPLPAEVGRTTFHTTRVLHHRDIPVIQKRLVCLQGVRRVGVNLAESVVFVEHDVSKVTAAQLSDQLAGRRRSSSAGSTTTTIQNTKTVETTNNDTEDDRNVDKVVMTDDSSSSPSSYADDGFYDNTIAADALDEIAERTTTAMTMARSKFVESTLTIRNLTLQHVPILEKTLRQNFISSQLRAFYPHVPSKTVKLEHNPQLLRADAVVDVLLRVGMDVMLSIDGGVENLALPLLEDYEINPGGVEGDGGNAPIHGGMTADEQAKLHYNVILSGVFWFISILSLAGGEWEDLAYAGLLSVVFGLPPIIVKAYRTLRRCQFDANCMMVTAAIGALCLGEFDEAASVAFLFAVSEYLEARASERARKALAAIVTLRPDHANLVHPVTKELVIVPAEKIPVGSLISVRTGDKICSDGKVVEGMSAVDESSLTGEAVPVTKRVHDLVSGGSINVGDEPLIIKTTTSVEDSAVSRLIRLVEEAQANRSPTEKMVDGFAKRYTPVILIMATLMCTIPWIFGREIGRYWTLNGLIIIVIACPCALTISTPVTYAAGLAATAQRGIIVKGGSALEALGSVDKVIFDKTGTLTNGKFVLNKLEATSRHMRRDEVLGLLALMEAPSSHPLSQTLVAAARAEGVSIPRHKMMENHTVLRGEGIEAKIDGEMVYVGNRRLFTRLNLYDSLGSYQATTEDWSRRGGTVGFIGMEGKGIVGAFCVTDEIRMEAPEVIRQLREGDIEVIMLTGDTEGAAQAVAKQIGLPSSAVKAQLLPEDKLHYVGSLIQPPPKNCAACASKSLVLMCGDGINDAPALAVADVGVAMGEGAALAMEMSDITLMDSNISKLVFTLKMGTRVVMTIQENIALSLVAKILVIGLTFGGFMTLFSAIAADVGVMLIVTLNGMKLLPSSNRESMMLVRRHNDRRGLKATTTTTTTRMDMRVSNSSTTSSSSITSANKGYSAGKYTNLDREVEIV